MCLRGFLVRYQSGVGEFSLRDKPLIPSLPLNHVILAKKMPLIIHKGEVHGVTIVNSLVRSNTVRVTSSGIRVRISPSGGTSAVSLGLS
jgi:hypothetical protein